MTHVQRRPSLFTRRGAVFRFAGLALGAAALASCGGANGDTDVTSSSENVLGDPNAPVTIIEYASTTCPHCANFHQTVFPELKERYIDTGQVKLVFRELPTSPESLALAGMMMARCAGPDKYFDVIDVLMDRQMQLVRAYQQGGGAALEELLRIAGPAGLTPEEFDACIRDDATIEEIRALGEEARDRWGVTGTPAFIIHGELMEAAPTIEAFEERLEPLLDDQAS